MKHDDFGYIDFADALHIEVHALRLNPPGKVSPFEFKVNKMIAELYADDCKECKEKTIQYKYQPQPVQASQGGFLRGLFK